MNDTVFSYETGEWVNDVYDAREIQVVTDTLMFLLESCVSS